MSQGESEEPDIQIHSGAPSYLCPFVMHDAVISAYMHYEYVLSARYNDNEVQFNNNDREAYLDINDSEI